MLHFEESSFLSEAESGESGKLILRSALELYQDLSYGVRLTIYQDKSLADNRVAAIVIG